LFPKNKKNISISERTTGMDDEYRNAGFKQKIGDRITCKRETEKLLGTGTRLSLTFQQL